MDRDAMARARRRRELGEALDEEREREAALLEQVELVVTEEEGARIDRELLELLEPAEAALLADLFTVSNDDEEEDELEWEDDGAEAAEDEVARLLEEIEHSRARQRALERAVQLLG